MNRDILFDQLARTNVGYLSSTVDVFGNGLSKETKEGMIDDRLNPLTFFSRLTVDPKKLLDAMEKHKVVLSGSRAASYFYPQASDDKSDWDFYTSSAGSHIIDFIKVLCSLGGILNDIQCSSEDSERIQEGYDNLSAIVLLSMGESKIQLMITNSLTVLDTILGFDISVVQCFISGSFAMSLYHSVSKDSKAIYWSQDKVLRLQNELKTLIEYTADEPDSPREDSLQSRIDILEARQAKYTSRGFESESYIEYHKRNAQIPFIHKEHGKMRRVGDAGCGIIKFERYDLLTHNDLGIKDDRLLDFMIWKDESHYIVPIRIASTTYPEFKYLNSHFVTHEKMLLVHPLVSHIEKYSHRSTLIKVLSILTDRENAYGMPF